MRKSTGSPAAPRPWLFARIPADLDSFSYTTMVTPKNFNYHRGLIWLLAFAVRGLPRRSCSWSNWIFIWLVMQDTSSHVFCFGYWSVLFRHELIPRLRLILYCVVYSPVSFGISNEVWISKKVRRLSFFMARRLTTELKFVLTLSFVVISASISYTSTISFYKAV